MARVKIDYGIDLGTTNSAICRMEKGEPIIIKSDTLKDTMPSCVSFTKKGSTKVGDASRNALDSDRVTAMLGKKVLSDTFFEFKRTMATTTPYSSPFIGKDFSSEELSAEVLKALKSFITDENVPAAVITVPAKFTVNQKTATLEAARLAGFTKCELLQEPIAAAMAYGLSSDSKNGIWMVFDFGGGTFDAALLKVEDGIIQPFDTEGDNYLGGKNLDYAIVDEIIIPYLQANYSLENRLAEENQKRIIRDAMKIFAERAKIQLSFKDHEDIALDYIGQIGEDEDGEELDLDITVTQEQLFNVMRPYFQKAVDICKDLLKRNNLTGDKIDKLILVGGPTYSPLIREMLREQVTPNVDTSIDPMTAVAVGAALYASTMDADVKSDDVEVGTIMLDLGYESTSVETTEWVSAKLQPNQPLHKVLVELVRSDKAWSSGKMEVDETGNVIEANLLESKPNSFEVKAYNEKGNLLPCFPNEITIIQGSKVGAAPLPYNIGIAVWNDTKKRAVFKMARGLEKSKPVPAVGVVNDLKVPYQLRPGVESDIMRIPVYQVDDFEGAEGRSAALYEYVADVVITGDDVDTLVTADSTVDITLKVDTSEQMTLEAHFLATDITVEKRLDTSKKQSIEDAAKEISNGIPEAQRSINRLNADGIDTGNLQADLDAVKDEAANSSEKKAVLQHLKEVLRKIEDRDSETEWDRLEKELREEFDRLEKAQNELGNEKTAQLVKQLRQQTDQVIRAKDAKLGHEVLEQITALFFSLTLVYQCMGFIRHYNDRFGAVQWKNSARARQLLNQGLENINNNPSVEVLHPIVCNLIELMPDDGTRPHIPGQ